MLTLITALLVTTIGSIYVVVVAGYVGSVERNGGFCMRVYNVLLELPDKERKIIECMLVAANFQQATQLVAGIYGKRASILSIIEKS